jgi:hypothetical protein
VLDRIIEEFYVPCMSTTEIMDAALLLSTRERGRLIAALMQSLEIGGSMKFENADEAEVLRRLDTSPAARRRATSVVSRAAIERLTKRRR